MGDIIDPKCPSCGGKGKPEEYGWERGKWVKHETAVEIACPLCFADRDRIERQARELLDIYSGNSRLMRELAAHSERQDEVWAGEEGQEYRRLLKWLWADKSGGDKKCGRLSKKESGRGFTPFKKLFAFEPKLKPYTPRELAPRPIPARNTFMECTVETKVLLRALNEVMKIILRKSVLPILSCVKIEVEDRKVKVSSTDLESWVTEEIPGRWCVDGAVIISGYRFRDIARVLRGEVAIVGLDFDVVELRCGDTVYKLSGLGVENWPRNPNEETKEREFKPEWGW